MKRWIILIAHVGGVLIALSLVLYLASLIPYGVELEEPRSQQILLAKTFIISYASPYGPLNPLRGVEISIETNETLNIKVFQLKYKYIEVWFKEHSSPLNWTGISHNGTLGLLEEFVNTHPNFITREQNVPAGKTVFEYVPPKIENVTIIISNYTPSAVYFVNVNKTIYVVVSRERAFFALMITTPLGVGLTVPWLFSTLKEARKTERKGYPPIV